MRAGTESKHTPRYFEGRIQRDPVNDMQELNIISEPTDETLDNQEKDDAKEREGKMS